MGNLSQLSDQQLDQLIQAKSQPQDISSLSDEQLDSLIAAKSSKQYSTREEIARPFLRAGKSIVAGTVGGAADLAALAAEAPVYAGYKATQAITGDKTPYKPIFADKSVTQAINQGFDKMTGGLTANRNRAEEILEIPQEIAGAIIGPGAIQRTTKAAVDLASLGGKKIVQKIAGITQKSPELLKAFQDANINPTLANIAEGGTTKTFQNLLGNFPGSRGVIEKATQDQVDNITKQIAGIAKSEGGTIQQTGKKLQEGAKNLQTFFSQRADHLYNDLDKYIPKNAAGENAAIPTNNFTRAINSPEVQDVAAVKGGTIQGLINRYEKLGDGKGAIPYDRAKIFRGTIGKESYSFSLSESEKAAAKQLYGALSQDMKAAVVAGGGEKGLQAFNKANNAFYRHLAILDTKINPLVEAKTPELVYSMALKGSRQGGSNIKIIMRSLDSDQQDFVRGTMVKRMGLSNKGEQDAAGEVFSPAKFLSEWNDLSPEARSNIFKKDQIAAVDNLNKAIFTIKQTAKARQSSNNLPYAAWAGLGGVTVANPGVGLAGVGLARITAKMMTNPKVVNWLAQTPKIKPAQIPQHLKILSAIASQHPELREDILDYMDSIVSDANAGEPDNAALMKLAEEERKRYPGIYANTKPEEQARMLTRGRGEDSRLVSDEPDAARLLDLQEQERKKYPGIYANIPRQKSKNYGGN